MLERRNTAEDSDGDVATATHTALRAIMRALLEDPIEAQNMSKMLDATLGPMPTGGRT